MLHARDEDEPHVYKGNLALTASQQPSPLFGFGQAILEKHDLQLFGYVNSLIAKHANYTQVTPNILYGITNALTLTAGVPVAAKFKNHDCHSADIGDVFIQGEYAFYNKALPNRAMQCTLLAAISFNSGSIKKNPPTGFGSPTFTIGATAGYMSIDWYASAGVGGILTTPHHNAQFPHSAWYQLEIAKNLYYISQKLIITIMAEFFGSYAPTSRIRGPHYKNFDDNNFYIGPSLWVATKHLIFNPGIAWALYRSSKNILVSLDIGWKF